MADQSDAGLLLGSWSPDGARLLVYRLKEETLEVGIVSLADRTVEWTGLTPDLPITGLGSAWLDADRLVISVRPQGDLPWLLRFDGTGRVEMEQRWRLTTDGRSPSRNRVETRAGRVTTDAQVPEQAVLLLDLRTGSRRTLAQGVIRDLAPSPDGAQVAILASAERAGKDPSGHVVQGAVQTRSRLSIVGTDEGAARAVFDLDVAPHLMRWNPESRSLLVWARHDHQPWAEARLTSLCPGGAMEVFETDGLEPLPKGAVVDEFQAVQADWLDGAPVLRARSAHSERFDWWRVGVGDPHAITAGMPTTPVQFAAASQDRALAFAGGRLWALSANLAPVALTPEGEDLRDGQTRTLMEPARARLSEAPRRDWTIARTETDVRLLDRAGAALFVIPSSTCRGVRMGRSVAAASVASICLDQGVETLRLETRSGTRDLDVVNAGFAALDVPQPQAVVHLDHRGGETTSYLYLPPGRTAAEVKGLIVQVYPGSVNNGRFVEATSLAMGMKPQLLASTDYAVLFAALADEQLSVRDEMIDDFVRGVELAVDAALRAEPDLPESRMAVAGHSFGGYTALAIATRSRRFGAYVSWAGPTDLFGKWGELMPHARVWPGEWTSIENSIGAVETNQTKMGGPPWANLDGYAQASPYLLADRIEDPVLLVAADRDYVPMSQAERMLIALHRQNKWVRLVTYWGETHTNGSPANIRDVYREIFDWLDRTLGEERATVRPGDAPMPEPSPRPPPSS